MIARKYDKRVAVRNANTLVDDGFGGHTVTDSLVGSSWCKIESIPRDRFSEFGIEEPQEAIRIRLRHRNDLNYSVDGIYFVYKGIDWIPISVQTVSQEEVEVNIIAISNADQD